MMEVVMQNGRLKTALKLAEGLTMSIAAHVASWVIFDLGSMLCRFVGHVAGDMLLQAVSAVA
jgi:hypothetical protein